MIRNQIVAMVALPCEYTKNHYAVHLKSVNFMEYELYLNFENEDII